MFDIEKKGKIRLPLAVRVLDPLRIQSYINNPSIAKIAVRGLDPIKFYPYTNNPLIARRIEEILGTYRPMADSGLEMMLTPPPEGVLKGESVPVENDRVEFEELLAKARERRINSLERQERLKKEVDE